MGLGVWGGSWLTELALYHQAFRTKHFCTSMIARNSVFPQQAPDINQAPSSPLLSLPGCTASQLFDMHSRPAVPCSPISIQRCGFVCISNNHTAQLIGVSQEAPHIYRGCWLADMKTDHNAHLAPRAPPPPPPFSHPPGVHCLQATIVADNIVPLVRRRPDILQGRLDTQQYLAYI